MPTVVMRGKNEIFAPGFFWVSEHGGWQTFDLCNGMPSSSIALNAIEVIKHCTPLFYFGQNEAHQPAP